MTVAKSRFLTAILAAAFALVLTGCGGGGGTSGLSSDSGANLVTAKALAFVSVDSDLGSSQWKLVDTLSRKFPARDKALAQLKNALAKAWGHKAVDIGAGGTIPFLFDLAELFPKAEIMVTGVEDPRSGAHGPDESVDLGELERACLAEAMFLERLAKR